MSDLLLPQLIVLAVGGSVAPPLFLLTILLLGSQRPLLNATTLVLGYFAVCATIGIVGLILFAGVVGAAGFVSTVDRGMSFILGSLLIVLRLRTLLLNTSDRAASAARWMESARYITPAKEFGIGMALFPIQIKNLARFIACMNLVAAANLSPGVSIVALVVVLMVLGRTGSRAYRPLRGYAACRNELRTC